MLQLIKYSSCCVCFSSHVFPLLSYLLTSFFRGGELKDIPLCLKYNIKMELIMYSFWHNYLFYFIIISIIGY